MLPPSEDVPGGATGLPGRVAQLYYTYGLFAASHPRLLSSLVLSVAVICRWVGEEMAWMSVSGYGEGVEVE